MTIACLNANSDGEVWTYKYKNDEGSFTEPCSSPVIDGNNLYTFSRNGG
ncbi:MAG: hypothetical protein JEZ09_13570 [Salinivirgaceae bacterium]|nr:hypothetical protein [Salinivirgaceae bacterium]